ncbi:hypothetical protein [Burkholderia pseudomallei]|uniref:hypothetical protein n=2 Tax=Burkholderia pseudomallei TaxID=28450 RepID=UPI0029328F70|nr:hypothetical protein [Burkholderia pseudomallei]MDV2160770.1 hypothetical protein [Burkholderia pseudomallei]MDV2234220.1 hypothetical protein [Burkholderia pseudomallei]
MGQVTEETCRLIIEYADRDDRFPLTVNEMRQLAYLASQQIKAARRTTPDREAIIEECAKVCDEDADDKWNLYKGQHPYTGRESGRADPYVEGRADGASVCADRIRALKTVPTSDKGGA